MILNFITKRVSSGESFYPSQWIVRRIVKRRKHYTHREFEDVV